MKRPNKALDLARMLIKQAKMLKSAGMVAEARAAARRALDLHAMGHASAKYEMVPVRTRRR